MSAKITVVTHNVKRFLLLGNIKQFEFRKFTNHSKKIGFEFKMLTNHSKKIGFEFKMLTNHSTNKTDGLPQRLAPCGTILNPNTSCACINCCSKLFGVQILSNTI